MTHNWKYVLKLKWFAVKWQLRKDKLISPQLSFSLSQTTRYINKPNSILCTEAFCLGLEYAAVHSGFITIPEETCCSYLKSALS